MSSSKNPDLKGVNLSSSEAIFYDSVYAAAQVRQLALSVPNITQSAATSADVTYHRAVVSAAAAASGLGVLGNPSRDALHSLTGSYI